MKVFLGIEIGDACLKIAVAKHKAIQATMYDCIVEPIAKLSDEAVSDLIVDHIKKAKYKSKTVSVSLPRNFVTVRNLHLPSSDEEEIKKMISFHISRIVPHKKEAVVFSYCLSGIDDMGYKRITLAIAYNEVIKRQLRILDKAGFLVEKITLSSYYVWRRIIKKFKTEINQTDLYVALDIDSTFSDFIVFEKDNLLFTRSMAVKKRDVGAELGLNKFLGEVRQSLLIFQNEEINKKPQKIFLSGATDSGIARKIEDELQIPVQFIPPPLFGERSKSGEKTVDSNISFTAVSSLIAVDETEKVLSFDLPEMKIRKSLRADIKELLVLGVLILYSICLVCLIFLGRIYNQEFYLQQVKDSSARIEQDVGTLGQQLGKINFTKKYLNNRRAHLFALFKLQSLIPENMAFTALLVNAENKVTLRGQVFELSEVFELVNNLGQVNCFKEVQTKNTRKGKWKDQVVTDFEITFMLDVGN